MVRINIARMIELKAIVKDKPSGKERIRYMVRMEGSRTFITKELNPEVKLNKKNVINRIAYDYKVKKSEIIFNDDLLTEHELYKKAISKIIKEGGGMRRRHARN